MCQWTAQTCWNSFRRFGSARLGAAAVETALVKRALSPMKRLATDTSANFAVMTALCAVPMFGIMGLAIDYGILLSNKTKLDAAADAAAVAAVTKAKAVLNGGGTLDAAKTAGKAQGLASFASNSGRLAFPSTSGAITPTVTFDSTLGQTLNVTVSYAMQSQSQFGKLFNVANHSISGSAGSWTVVVPYYQFIFVVDISGSMAIGGTAKDINGLVADANIKCAFACHDPKNARGPDYRAYAKDDGWTLKIDYVKTAVQNFISDLKTQTTGMAGVFSVGIDEFATDFYTLQSPTSDLSLAATQAGKIDIESMTTLNISQGYTRTTTSLQAALAAVSSTIGDGSGPSKQVTYFIFLSDGVEDIEGNMTFGRGTDVSYTTACQEMKDKKATLISISAPYPVINNDNSYKILVAPWAPPAAQNYQKSMQDCATDKNTWSYEATDGPGINTAVHSALSKILQGMTRLTN